MKILSLGVGVQSTTLYFMSSIGFIDRVDHAIFSDTGLENPSTYTYIQRMMKWADKNNGIPIHWMRSKNLYVDLMNKTNSTGDRFAPIPAYSSEGDGILRRQCTREYKIDVINRKIRELHGLKQRQRMKPTEMWLGISIDEVSRAKDSRFYNITNRFPLLELMYSRSNCKKWLTENGFEIPDRSACEFCPYHSDYEWKRIKQDKKRWSKVIELDEAIRDMTIKGVTHPAYLHKSCKPINEVYLQEDQSDLFDNECEGMCGL